MRLLRFLGKEIAAGGNPVLQRDGVDRQRTVFHHQRMAAGIDRIETHFELHAPAEQIHHGTQVSLDLLRTVHDQLAGASQHAERGDQSRQTEAVVAMQMRDEIWARRPKRTRIRRICTWVPSPQSIIYNLSRKSTICDVARCRVVGNAEPHPNMFISKSAICCLWE